MNDLVKCTRCQKVLMNEEYDQHICMPEIKRWKNIKFTHYYIIKNEQGRTIIGIRDMDGTKYDFEEIPEDKQLTKIPYQPRGNTYNNTEEGTEPAIRFCQIYGGKVDCQKSVDVGYSSRIGIIISVNPITLSTTGVFLINAQYRINPLGTFTGVSPFGYSIFVNSSHFIPSGCLGLCLLFHFSQSLFCGIVLLFTIRRKPMICNAIPKISIQFENDGGYKVSF